MTSAAISVGGIVFLLVLGGLAIVVIAAARRHWGLGLLTAFGGLLFVAIVLFMLSVLSYVSLGRARHQVRSDILAPQEAEVWNDGGVRNGEVSQQGFSPALRGQASGRLQWVPVDRGESRSVRASWAMLVLAPLALLGVLAVVYAAVVGIKHMSPLILGIGALVLVVCLGVALLFVARGAARARLGAEIAERRIPDGESLPKALEPPSIQLGPAEEKANGAGAGDETISPPKPDGTGEDAESRGESEASNAAGGAAESPSSAASSERETAGGESAADETEPGEPAASQPMQRPPAWVGTEGGRDGELLRRIVVGQRFADPARARRHALEEAVHVAHSYLREELGERVDGWDVPAWFVNDDLVKEEYTERLDSKFGEIDPEFSEMYRTHLLVELSPELRDRMQLLWRREVVEERSWSVAGGLLVLMMFLGTLLGYLKLDEATHGYYRGWLKAAAAAMVLGVAAVGFVILA